MRPIAWPKLRIDSSHEDGFRHQETFVDRITRGCQVVAFEKKIGAFACRQDDKRLWH